MGSQRAAEASGVGMNPRPPPWKAALPIELKGSLNSNNPHKVAFCITEATSHTGAWIVRHNFLHESSVSGTHGAWAPRIHTTSAILACLPLKLTRWSATSPRETEHRSRRYDQLSASDSLRISIDHPVNFAAKRTFCASLPIARDA